MQKTGRITHTFQISNFFDYILFIFMNNQDYYQLPKRTIRAINIIYHIFKPNNYRDVQVLYQGKASMDMTRKKFKIFTSTWWNKNYQPLTIVVTKDKNTGRKRLEVNSIFVPDSSPF